ncbi:hypothetical protein PHSY_002332 [Pseudozyma hubeiensis SY62]|uniref:Uncharacterized protein n=1 Tax=Pseudozyma hubeiensis (strain SY62) TaxID=1305764 RepID=R9P0U9_PSEHS|nr:hypothetical protein PHSY_002332 [Pseudozyma hubeiensis SY62]GAC94759.1 hypothetical protein PHSY_002332 [Pseudozyma hubeiensis SY62]
MLLVPVYGRRCSLRAASCAGIMMPAISQTDLPPARRSELIVPCHRRDPTACRNKARDDEPIKVSQTKKQRIRTSPPETALSLPFARP